jgi:hypothetical protein
VVPSVLMVILTFFPVTYWSQLTINHTFQLNHLPNSYQNSSKLALVNMVILRHANLTNLMVITVMVMRRT